MSMFGFRVQAYVALTAVCMIAVAGCATLPDTAALIERHEGQTARFESARGPLSAKTNAAIRNARDHINLESYIIEDDEIGRQFADLLLQQQARGVQLNIIYDIVRAIGSTPDDPFSLIYLALISAIGNAQRQVYLTNAYFVPDHQLQRALTDAVARGVDVKLILPSHSDSSLVFYAGRAHYSELLRGCVKLYERAGAVLHSKTAVIDGVWSTVGSSNLDWRSFVDDDEVNVAVLGREFAQQMLTAFTRDLQASQNIDLPTWERRPLGLRLKEWAARMWARLL